MSIFNIKLKTKNGNDIKKKETFTVFFRVNYKKGLTTTAEYTYRIMYSKGVDDPQVVLALKKAKEVKSLEDLTLKVILNICHIISQLANKENIDPDFIMFISPDLGNKNNAWKFLTSVFKRPQHNPNKANPTNWLADYTADYERSWDNKTCNKYRIKKSELDMLKAFSDSNPNTKFMSVDPVKFPDKYAKSIVICNSLQDRMNRNTQLQMDVEKDSAY